MILIILMIKITISIPLNKLAFDGINRNGNDVILTVVDDITFLNVTSFNGSLSVNSFSINDHNDVVGDDDVDDEVVVDISYPIGHINCESSFI